MVMAVLVKNTPETVARPMLSPLALGSILGTAYVLGSLGVVFYGIPAFWEAAISPWLERAVGVPVSVTLLLVLVVAAAVGLVVLGLRLAGPQPPHGVRAGIFAGVLEVIAITAVTCTVGQALETRLGPGGGAAGIAATVLFGVVLLAGAVYLLTRPAYQNGLLALEDQGWFTVKGYKGSQGQKVRRGTILGVLILAGCGIYTLLERKTVGVSANWQVTVPFTGGHHLVFLPDVGLTLPLLLSALSLWLAYRVVNLPTFADFLIATEAELNKVSWTTRPRLIQDTVVVMVTVILLTLFLFMVDQSWGFILSRIGVLQIAPTETQQAGPKEQPW